MPVGARTLCHASQAGSTRQMQRQRPHSRLIGDEGMILVCELEHRQRRRQIVNPVDFRDDRAFSDDHPAAGWGLQAEIVITSVNCQRSIRVVVPPAGSVSDHQYIVCDV